MRIMGLDVGESRIGIALSDPLGKTAQPLDTIKRDDASIDRIEGLVREHVVQRVVAGLPLLMDGSEGAQARLVRRFTGELAERLEVPVVMVDERLTTREAESVLAGGRSKRGAKRAASDRIAAAIILRAYMDGFPEA